jgi:hypothetical protein
VILSNGVAANAALLIHEMLHVYSGLPDDISLAQKFGWGGNPNNGPVSDLAASVWLDAFLRDNCRDPMKNKPY